MSSNELPQHPKRKHSEDGTEDDIVEALRQWKKRELSPESSEQAETLLAAATKSQAKSKSAALADKIQDLEAQLQQAKAELEESQEAEQKAQADISDFSFMLKYGDWFSHLLKGIRFHEPEICKDDAEIFRDQYKAAYQDHADAVKEAAVAQAQADGVAYHGYSEEQRVILMAEKASIQKRANKTAKWDCLNGARHTTSARDMIKAERKAVVDWHESGGSEHTAPGTPFLDRIQRLCDKAGVTRVQCLEWINHYAERNEACHNPPPQVHTFWMKNAAGEDLQVDNPKNAYRVIDWASMKAAVDNFKAEVENKYTDGSLSEERRTCIMGLADHYWKSYSIGTDEAGNPVPTDFAKREAEDFANGRAEANPDPPHDYLKKYHVGKWDDLL
ncbi:hypothetical protein FPCIR_5668 [Fusarium pseudocircinatum]|uniref:Uncharacterized protein n=1 Tax=Fusarium pseudocircinatum TaxID=56676 RepID=A0A8H5P913_9HYPO|nr:hypothetical protein FPCIR_5668 [Fusarium pseudocircinatum]